MKRMTWIALAIAAAVVTGQAWAGSSCCPVSKKSKEASYDKKCSSALSGLDLTEEQKEKISAIEETCKANGSTVEACKDSMAQIREVLTDDQRTAFDAASAKSTKKEGCGS